MLRGIVLVGTLLSFSGAMAQEYVLDNLPADRSSAEVFFAGQWCAGAGKNGTQFLESCAPRNTDSSQSYAPNLPSGMFDVFVRWVENKRSPRAVPVVIHYSMFFENPDTGFVLRRGATDGPVYLNQTKGGGTWWYLGRYSSVGGSNALGVTLIDDVGSAVSTDGARFVRVGHYPLPQ